MTEQELVAGKNPRNIVQATGEKAQDCLPFLLNNTHHRAHKDQNLGMK